MQAYSKDCSIALGFRVMGGKTVRRTGNTNWSDSGLGLHHDCSLAGNIDNRYVYTLLTVNIAQLTQGRFHTRPLCNFT